MEKRRKRVSIISRESNDKTLDVAMLEAELRARGAEVTTLCRLLTKEKSLKALGYIGHVARQEAAILRSDAVVLDTYCISASMLPHRRGTKVIQMWHALGAVKKFGWQTVGKEGGSSERTAKLMRMHRGYDYVVSASDISSEYFCEAFGAEPGAIVKYGLPRIDYIKSVASGERRQDMLKKIYARYPQLSREESGGGDAKRPLVLYAPTFRRGQAVDTESLINALGTENYDIVVKLHPLYREGSDAAKSSDAGGGVIYDDSFSSYDWLAAADAVISDYSSFIIEATLADKPLYIYAYDLKDYSKSTGLNMDFDKEPIAPYVFGDARALAEELGRAGSYDFDALRAFRDRYIDIDTQNCTAALADFIMSQA